MPLFFGALVSFHAMSRDRSQRSPSSRVSPATWIHLRKRQKLWAHYVLALLISGAIEKALRQGWIQQLFREAKRPRTPAMHQAAAKVRRDTSLPTSAAQVLAGSDRRPAQLEPLQAQRVAVLAAERVAE